MEEPNELEGSLFKDFKFDSLIAEKELKDYISKQKELGGKDESSQLTSELEKKSDKTSKLTPQEEEQNLCNKALIMGRQSIETASKMGISNFIVPSKLPDWAKSKIDEDRDKNQDQTAEKQPQVSGKWKGRLQDHSNKSLEIENLIDFAEKLPQPLSTKSTDAEEGLDKQVEEKKIEEVKLENSAPSESSNPWKFDNMKIRDDLQFAIEDEYEDVVTEPVVKLNQEGPKKIEQPISFEKKPAPTVSVPSSDRHKILGSEIGVQNKPSGTTDSHQATGRSVVSNPFKGRSLANAHSVQKEFPIKVNEQEIDLGFGLKIQVETVDPLPISSNNSELPIAGKEQFSKPEANDKRSKSPKQEDRLNFKESVVSVDQTNKEEPSFKKEYGTNVQVKT